MPSRSNTRGLGELKLLRITVRRLASRELPPTLPILLFLFLEPTHSTQGHHQQPSGLYNYVLHPRGGVQTSRKTHTPPPRGDAKHTGPQYLPTAAPDTHVRPAYGILHRLELAEMVYAGWVIWVHMLHTPQVYTRAHIQQHLHHTDAPSSHGCW